MSIQMELRDPQHTYASKTLSNSERNYYQTERESLSIMRIWFQSIRMVTRLHSLLTVSHSSQYSTQEK